MLFNRLPLQIFDARHWNGFEGCWNLVKGNPMFSDAEIEEAEITISKYEGKSVQVAYDSMMKSLEDIKKQKAITALLVYCGIYSTYYYLEDGITPYQFISWAKDRTLFSFLKTCCIGMKERRKMSHQHSFRGQKKGLQSLKRNMTPPCNRLKS